ncbi:MAG: succinate dehydrogenase, hydrophobic membrane anchor protein [Porticoccus sp.]|jgi:succinate dehydrogenase / fumarate reductase membrane anchor subunit|nr:succinate dehydrogenase, hydrophobic membrane anchor protein [Porticoccus sp.]
MGVITNVTSFGRSGLSDWLLQRTTAIVLAVYVVFVTFYLLTNPDLQYNQWLALNSHLCMKVLNILTVLSIAIHAWIGLWAVLTDYVTVRLLGPKATPLRIVLQLGMILVTLVYVIWALDIVWGI